MGVDRLFGKVGNQRGDSAELCVQRAMVQGCNNGTLPDWLIGYERADPRDDRGHGKGRGTDGWVETSDVGDIGVQIKSSEGSARRFRESHPNIAVVVVNQGDGFEDIVREVVSAVEPLRSKYLKKREGWQ